MPDALAAKRRALAASSPAYAELLAAEAEGRPFDPGLAWGVTPGPAWAAPAFESFTDRQARLVREGREWYAALPESVKDAARDCPHRAPAARNSCCGPVEAHKCVGGPRHDQYVDTLACARCKAEPREVPR